MKTRCYEISVYILQTWHFSIKVPFFMKDTVRCPHFHCLCWNNTVGLGCLGLIAVARRRILGLVSLVLPAEGGPKWEASLTNCSAENNLSPTVCALFLLHRSSMTNYILLSLSSDISVTLFGSQFHILSARAVPKLGFSIWNGRDVSIS